MKLVAIHYRRHALNATWNFQELNFILDKAGYDDLNTVATMLGRSFGLVARPSPERVIAISPDKLRRVDYLLIQ